MDSCVRGFHMYQEIWTPVSGEYLIVNEKEDNIQKTERRCGWPRASHNFMSVYH